MQLRQQFEQPLQLPKHNNSSQLLSAIAAVIATQTPQAHAALQGAGEGGCFQFGSQGFHWKTHRGEGQACVGAWEWVFGTPEVLLPLRATALNQRASRPIIHTARACQSTLGNAHAGSNMPHTRTYQHTAPLTKANTVAVARAATCAATRAASR